MKRILGFLALPFFMSSCAADVPMLSIMTVVVSPQSYHKEEIIVRGYLFLDHESHAIYFSKEHAEAGLTENAIWVSFSDDIEAKYMYEDINKQFDKSYFHNKYVMIRGRFNKKSKGHMGAYVGELTVNYIADMIPAT